MFRNKKIGTKLALSSGLAVLLMIGIAFNQYTSTQNIYSTKGVLEREQTILDGIVNAQLALADLRFQIRGIDKARSPSDVSEVVQAIQTAERRGSEGLEQPIAIAMKPKVLEDIRDALKSYAAQALRRADAVASLVSTAPAGTVTADAVLAAGQAVPSTTLQDIADAAATAIQQSKANASGYTAGANAALSEAIARANAIGLSIQFLVIAILLGSSYALFLGVARPVRQMASLMRRLSEGDTGIKILHADQSDEIGEMAQAVEVFRKSAIDNQTLQAAAESHRLKSEEERAQTQRQAEMDASRRLSEATAGLASGLRNLADGRLDFRLTERFSPEFETLREDFNMSITQLENTIGSVVGAVGTMRVGLNEIAVAAGDLSQRTESQAASLEETVAALGEVVRGINQTAQGAEDARAAAALAQIEAEKGGGVVSQAVGAMAAIEASSEKIGRIIGVIDEIAFQTNLLALNAGVEAARAGEAGRGFAVVAQEVRGLAQRSAEAAKEIKDLISTSSAQVSQGVEFVSASGRSLEQILAQVGGVTTMVSQMAQGAREQSLALKEVSIAADQMDKVTQQNAAMVDETTAAAKSLSAETEQLAALVDNFRTSTKGDAVQQARPVRPAPAASQSRPVKQMRTTGRGGAAPKPAPAAEEWADF